VVVNVKQLKFDILYVVSYALRLVLTSPNDTPLGPCYFPSRTDKYTRHMLFPVTILTLLTRTLTLT